MIGIDTTDYDKSVSTDEVKHKPQVGDVRYLWSSADRAPEGLLRATILSIEDDGRLSCRLDLLTAHVDLDPAEWASGGGTGYRRPLPREDGALTIGEALHLLKDLPDDQVSYLRPDFGCSYRGDAPSLGIITSDRTTCRSSRGSKSAGQGSRPSWRFWILCRSTSRSTPDTSRGMVKRRAQRAG